MKVKTIILIFFLGIILGVGLSPFTNKNPQDAFLSPTSPTLAETDDLTLPATTDQVLGTAESSCSQCNKTAAKKTTTSSKEPEEQISQFGTLLATVIATKSSQTNKTTVKQQSNYTGKITIALFGDSMIDVMGTNLTYLKTSLQNYYPQAQLRLLNYGVGAQTITQGLERIDQEYQYKDRSYPPLTQSKADIVILGSFSYNPFGDETDELYRHWANLTTLVDLIKNQVTDKVIILAEIAPNKENFGQGPKGVNWDQDRAWQHANKIQQYLENTIKFSQELNLPLANSYQTTLLSNKEGNLSYINLDDHIHQNNAGNSLIAKLIAEKIYQLKVFK